jgi:TPR repeat protein
MTHIIRCIALLLVFQFNSIACAQTFEIWIQNTGKAPIMAVVASKKSTLFSSKWIVRGWYNIGGGKTEHVATTEHAIVGFMNAQREQIVFQFERSSEKLPKELGVMYVDPANAFKYSLADGAHVRPGFAPLEMSAGIRAVGDVGAEGTFTMRINYDGSAGIPLVTNSERETAARKKQEQEELRHAQAAPRSSNQLENAAVSPSEAALVQGRKYLTGVLVPKDESKAFAWFTDAAELGSSEGMYWCGYMLSRGMGVTKDEKRAAEYFARAIASGNETAKLPLGRMLLFGNGVERDPKAAFGMLLECANRRSYEAMNLVGWMYETGTGTEIDWFSAMTWYGAASAIDPGYPMFRLGMMALNVDDSKNNEEVKQLAHHYISQSANVGYRDAMDRLGWMYETGTGAPRDVAKAREWYQKAAEAGSEWANGRLKLLDGTNK